MTTRMTRRGALGALATMTAAAVGCTTLARVAEEGVVLERLSMVGQALPQVKFPTPAPGARVRLERWEPDVNASAWAVLDDALAPEFPRDSVIFGTAEDLPACLDDLVLVRNRDTGGFSDQYIVAGPGDDVLAAWVRKVRPASAAWWRAPAGPERVAALIREGGRIIDEAIENAPTPAARDRVAGEIAALLDAHAPTRGDAARRRQAVLVA